MLPEPALEATAPASVEQYPEVAPRSDIPSPETAMPKPELPPSEPEADAPVVPADWPSVSDRPPQPATAKRPARKEA